MPVEKLVRRAAATRRFGVPRSISTPTKPFTKQAIWFSRSGPASFLQMRCMRHLTSCVTGMFQRTSNDEITLYKAVGTALADLAAATMVYEAALIAG
ncbi:hypothetical protein [Rhizobium leguminosarum]|uniref:hypothetical protein n=1 Tax=Rhizobium leguminosarum TaxID=384 RepID=UPI00396572BE